MNDKAPTIVILGGGTAGWMAANLFIRRWADRGVAVRLVESPDIGIIGVGEGSTPTLKHFFDLIDIADEEWMPRCNATYKVNIRFEGWSPRSGIDSYSHPFVSQVDTFVQKTFTRNCHARRLGFDVHTQPDDFFLNGILAKQHKGPQTPENFPLEPDYGYHFDAGLLGEYLGEVAVSRGVDHIQARVVDVERRQNGDIAALIDDTGRRIDGDLFVDCTGFASILMQKNLGVDFKSFKSNLFNDAAVVMPTPIVDDYAPETVSTALSNGWCWKIPLTSRFGNGYVYSSDHLQADDAETEFRRHLGMLDSDVDVRHLRMRVGQLARHWDHNCLALGLSQGFIEPLEATALLLVQVAIEIFMERYENAGFRPDHRDEYNRVISDRFERVRDYIVAHYKLNTRDDSDYWRANRDNMNLSDLLRHILDAWYRRRDLGEEIRRRKIQSHFTNLSWHCLFSGYGVYPPLADDQANRVDHYVESRVAEYLSRCALNFDSLSANLDRLQPNETHQSHARV
jgi:Tryptophan halogenase